MKILLGVLFIMIIASAGAQQSRKTLVKKAVSAKAATKKVVPKNTNAAPNSPFIKRVSAKDVRQMIDTSTSATIVNFWASWCGPCIREIPYFDSIIAAKNAPVKLLLVSLDFPAEYPTGLTQFVKKQGYKGTVVFLAETNADIFCPIIEKQWDGAIPASIFVDNSKKYYQFFGHQMTRERFSLEIDNLMK